jgi:hypothetical protein
MEWYFVWKIVGNTCYATKNRIIIKLSIFRSISSWWCLCWVKYLVFYNNWVFSWSLTKYSQLSCIVQMGNFKWTSNLTTYDGLNCRNICIEPDYGFISDTWPSESLIFTVILSRAHAIFVGFVVSSMWYTIIIKNKDSLDHTIREIVVFLTNIYEVVPLKVLYLYNPELFGFTKSFDSVSVDCSGRLNKKWGLIMGEGIEEGMALNLTAKSWSFSLTSKKPWGGLPSQHSLQSPL